jgi:hypothetical protein
MSYIFGQYVDKNGKIIKDIKSWRINNPNEKYFDSKFEYDCFKLLEKENFNFQHQPESRELIPSFTTLALNQALKGKRKLFLSTVRSINYTSDFLVNCNDGTKIYIEAKGFFQPDARIRYKLFQASLKANEISVIVYDKKKKGDNLTDIKALIEIIKEQFSSTKKDNQLKITL